MQKVTTLQSFPYHVVLLSVFFLSHGYAENYGFLPFKDLFLFFTISVIVTSIVCLVLSWLFRDTIKAGIFTFILLLVYLFFGSIVEGITQLVKMRYSVLLPLLLAVLIGIAILMNKSKRRLLQLNLYLNVLVIVLICYDLVSIVAFSNKEKDALNAVRPTFDSKLTICDSCKKPDIFFILLDQYSGSPMLKKYLGYENSKFENFLDSAGFHVIPNARSNYSTTILSIASTLNMSFIQGFSDEQFKAHDYSKMMPIINHNIVTDYLIKNNYHFFNYSIFNIQDKPSFFTHHFFPSNMQLILNKTLVETLRKDLHIDKKIGPFRLTFGVEWELDAVKEGNSSVLRNTIETAKTTSTEPKFVYSHLLMPHPPYIYDSLGNAINKPIERVPDSLLNSSYLSYLVYTNKVVSDLIRKLLASTNGESIIILLSDHGNKHFKPWPPLRDRFFTLNAVYYPDRQYNEFYNGFSNVNVFRTLFNKFFHQNLPMLTDSAINIHD